MPPTLRSLAMAELDWAEWKGEKQPSGAAPARLQMYYLQIKKHNRLTYNQTTCIRYRTSKNSTLRTPWSWEKKRQPITAILAQKVNQTNCDCRLSPIEVVVETSRDCPWKKPWRINSDQIFETREFDGSWCIMMDLLTSPTEADGWCLHGFPNGPHKFAGKSRQWRQGYTVLGSWLAIKSPWRIKLQSQNPNRAEPE